ncbi:MAG: ZIP family metal transporter [Planctomycetia bacterium]|nr:ZIP family metal transporter [Planctomycetia bacterium]
MSQTVLLIVYCLVIAAASLAGGWLPMLLRLSHTRLQLAMSFVGGAMLGVGLLHLLPHAYLELGAIYPCVWWLLAGFLAMFFIERVFHFHHHDAPGAPDTQKHGEDHGHKHEADAAHHHHAPGESRHGWRAALVGLALHSATDGMALAASVAAESDTGGQTALAGLAVFLVVALHKPFDSLTLSTLMTVTGEPLRTQHVVNLLYALAVPVGVLLFLAGVGQAGVAEGQIVGPALAFAAGTFLCISTSDLLPELQFHAHDRLKLSAALLLGLGLTAAIVLVESAHHGHEHGGQRSVDSGR